MLKRFVYAYLIILYCLPDCMCCLCVACPTVNCDPCDYVYVNDDNGCQICECFQPCEVRTRTITVFDPARNTFEYYTGLVVPFSRIKCIIVHVT